MKVSDDRREILQRLEFSNGMLKACANLLGFDLMAASLVHDEISKNDEIIKREQIDG